MLDDSHVEIILELAAIGIFEVLAISIVYDPNRELQTILCCEYATFVAIFLYSRREQRSLPMLNNQDILNCECQGDKHDQTSQKCATASPVIAAFFREVESYALSKLV